MRARTVLASVLLVVLAFGASGCGDRSVQEWIDSATPQPAVLVAYGAPQGNVMDGPRGGEMAGISLAGAINGLGIDLLRDSTRATSEDGTGNVVLSPLSVHAALTMAANGARGDTSTEMLAALGLDTIGLTDANSYYRTLLWRLDGAGQLTGTTVSVANSLWPDARLAVEQEFIDVNRTHFGAQLETLDLADPASVDRMNEWVAEHTGDRITDLVQPPLDPRFLYLINAVYLDAAWEEPFEANATRDMPFRPSSAEEISLPTMRRFGEFTYTDREGVQAVRLPYTYREIGMWVILPPAGTGDPRAALDEWISALDPAEWATLTNSASEREGLLTLPKVTTRFRAELTPALQAAGMRDAFASGADFTGIGTAPVDGEGLFIGGVVQETFLDIHEKGTEAAAGTAIGFGAESVDEEPVTEPFEMIVDRPFLIAIDLEPTGEFLFLGAIFDPR